MQEVELLLGVVEGVGAPVDKYTLFFTTTRVVAINTEKWEFGIGGFATAIGQIAKAAIKGRDAVPQSMSLNELLEANKDNFEIAYSDIDEIKLANLDSRWKRPCLQIYAGIQGADFYLDKLHVDKLQKLLPAVNTKIKSA